MINIARKFQIIEGAFKLMNQRRHEIVEEYYFGHSNITSEEAFEELIRQLEAIEYNAYNKLNLEAKKTLGGRRMKIDTEDLRKSASDLSSSLKDYFEDVERIQDEFDRTSSAINEVADEILDEDESNMMSALYGVDIEKMRMSIQSATYYLQQVWDNVDDLQIKIKGNDEALG